MVDDGPRVVNQVHITVKKTPGCQEWMVRFTINGKARPELTYFAGDIHDARDTAMYEGKKRSDAGDVVTYGGAL